MDKYRKVKIVGKGNFGHAVLVQSVNDRRLYIMKIIDVSKMDRKQKEEALNEVHVLKAMRHPYIVTYRESFMDKRCLCIVMDYADGGDMYTKIAKQKQEGKPFTEDQVLDWFVQMCLAMKHVHDRKILHRDLKTQNIFLTSKNEIKIGDFGIARVLQHTYDCAQTAIGTPYYLSPEICQEKPYNQKSDIWSLGCILYELLTLKHAFDANSMKGLVLKIMRGTYPPIPETYSQNTRDLVADLLIKDPHKRPSVRKILDKEFLTTRISQLFSRTVAHQQQQQVSRSISDPISQSITQERHTRQSSLQPSQQSQITSQTKEGQLQERKPSQASFHSHTKESDQQTTDSRQQIKVLQASKISYQKQQHQSSFDQENQEQNRQQVPDSSKLMIKQKNLIKFTSKPQQEEVKYSYQQHPPMKQKSFAQNDDEEGNYSELINSLKDCLEKKNRKIEESPDEENLQEDESQRVYAKFLRPDGKELVLPGVSEKDSIAYRIEALKVYLEQNIGDETFLKAYMYLQESNDGTVQEDNNDLYRIMGSKIKFLPLIYQLIVCEDSYYCN